MNGSADQPSQVVRRQSSLAGWLDAVNRHDPLCPRALNPDGCAAGARCRWSVPSCACRRGAVAGAARCHEVVAAGGEGLPATGDRGGGAPSLLRSVPACEAQDHRVEADVPRHGHADLDVPARVGQGSACVLLRGGGFGTQPSLGWSTRSSIRRTEAKPPFCSSETVPSNTA